MLITLVFFFSDVSSIFEIVKYLVGYSLALYIISTLSILFLGWQSLIKYLKNILLAIIVISIPLKIHHAIGTINALNSSLTLILNVLSLLLMMVLAYYALLISAGYISRVKK